MTDHKLISLSSQIPGIYAALTAYGHPSNMKIEIPTVWIGDDCNRDNLEDHSLLGSMIFTRRNFDPITDDEDPIISMQFYCRNHYLMLEDKS